MHERVKVTANFKVMMTMCYVICVRVIAQKQPLSLSFFAYPFQLNSTLLLYLPKAVLSIANNLYWWKGLEVVLNFMREKLNKSATVTNFSKFFDTSLTSKKTPRSQSLSFIYATKPNVNSRALILEVQTYN